MMMSNSSPGSEIPGIGNNLDLGRGILYLDGEIEAETAGWVARAFTSLESFEGTPAVYLNTPGGDVTAMFAIHDLIRKHEAMVLGYGQVHSAGLLLLAAGSRRFVTESCTAMWHEMTGGQEEGITTSLIRDRLRWEEWTLAHWCQLMGSYTPIKARQWKNITERARETYWLGSKEIIEAGLADGEW